MTKDAVATMGGVLPDDVCGRDAVHVAVISATARVRLHPGQHVGFIDTPVEDGFIVHQGLLGDDENPGEVVGIVDPFIKGSIVPGQRVWVFLYPRTITGLQHHWSHPSFDKPSISAPVVKPIPPEKLEVTPEQKLLSEQWLKNFCKTRDCAPYDIVKYEIAHLQDGEGDVFFSSEPDGEYLCFHGYDAHCDVPDEFWDHMSVVLERTIHKRVKYFTCSC